MVAVRRSVLLLVTTLRSSAVVQGKVLQGTVSSKDGFGFLGRFVFDCLAEDCSYPPSQCSPANYPDRPNVGQCYQQYTEMFLQINVTKKDCHRTPDHSFAVYCYDDQGYNEDEGSYKSWYRVWKDGAPNPSLIHSPAEIFKQKENGNGPVIFRLPDSSSPLPTSHSLNFQASPDCSTTHSEKISEGVRARAWFCVLGHTDSTGTQMKEIKDIQYSMKFLNQGGTMQKQFGKDEQGLNTMYLLMIISYAVMSLLFYFAWKQYKPQLRLMPKFLGLVILGHLISAAAMNIHYWTYTYNGVGHPFIKYFAECAESAAQSVLYAVLLLIAQGWAVVRSGIQNREQVAAVLGAYALVSLIMIALSAYPSESRDPTASLSYHFSDFGYILLVVKSCVAVLFVLTIRATVNSNSIREAGKRAFVKRFGQFYTVYLISMPVVTVILSFISPWSREYWVRTINGFVQFIAPAALLYLTWPSRLDQYFAVAGSLADANDASNPMHSMATDGNQGLLGSGGTV